MSNFFKDLKAGLEEIIDYKEGKIELRSISIEIPEPPAAYNAKDIKKFEKKNSSSFLKFLKNNLNKKGPPNFRRAFFI